MKPSTQHILNEVTKLPPTERAEILERIIESFDINTEDDIRKAWADEAEHRLSLDEKGDGNSISEDEVFKIIEEGQGR